MSIYIIAMLLIALLLIGVIAIVVFEYLIKEDRNKHANELTEIVKDIHSIINAPIRRVQLDQISGVQIRELDQVIAVMQEIRDLIKAAPRFPTTAYSSGIMPCDHKTPIALNIPNDLLIQRDFVVVSKEDTE